VSFIFVGGTGVGKTELVKRLAADLFDSPESLIRLDMSEFMEKFSVSRIIGSPPGYVGYDEAGQLTEKIRRKPYSVVLFDEIEKAHPDVLNILLQILDDGRITDAQGRTVNFENTVIIMTTNAGSNTKVGSVGFGGTVNDMGKERALKALNDFLRPEFINRVDEIVYFNSLTEDNFRSIAARAGGAGFSYLNSPGARDGCRPFRAFAAKGGEEHGDQTRLGSVLERHRQHPQSRLRRGRGGGRSPELSLRDGGFHSAGST
jgi:ATP-dependent Clp protease ATP-binding subunit ClpA